MSGQKKKIKIIAHGGNQSRHVLEPVQIPRLWRGSSCPERATPSHLSRTATAQSSRSFHRQLSIITIHLQYSAQSKSSPISSEPSYRRPTPRECMASARGAKDNNSGHTTIKTTTLSNWRARASSLVSCGKLLTVHGNQGGPCEQVAQASACHIVLAWCSRFHSTVVPPNCPSIRSLLPIIINIATYSSGWAGCPIGQVRRPESQAMPGVGRC